MMAWIIWFDELRRGCCWSKEWLWRQRAGRGQEDDEDGRRPTTTGTTTKMDDDEDDDAEDDAEDNAMTLAGADVQMI